MYSDGCVGGLSISPRVTSMLTGRVRNQSADLLIRRHTTAAPIRHKCITVELLKALALLCVLTDPYILTLFIISISGTDTVG